MLSSVAKFLLISTSLSPILGAVAVDQFANNQPWMHWLVLLLIAIILIFLCWMMLQYAARNIQRNLFTVREFERKDTETLAFMLAYLIPLISTDNIVFADKWLLGAYTFVIISLVITHAGAFHFNPVMGLLGYHFYSVKNQDGLSHLLISKKALRRSGNEIQVVQLAHSINLHVGETDA